MELFRIGFLCLCGLAVTAVAGCGSGPNMEAVADANKSNLQKVANSLYLYQSKVGKPAKNEEELCDFIANNDKIEKNLGNMKIDRSLFKEYLIGARDGEPLHVRYGVSIPYGGRIPLVLETVGVDGSRQVCWSDTKITEVTSDKEYANLKAGKVRQKDVMADATKAAVEAAETKAAENP